MKRKPRTVTTARGRATPARRSATGRAALVLGWALCALALPAAAADPSAQTSADARTRRAIEARLRGAPLITGVRVESVEGGVVRLEGIAPTHAARDRAASIARSTPGVRALANDVEVPAPGERAEAAEVVDTADAALTARVRLALHESVHVPGAQVDVDSDGGRVTLFGKVPTGRSRERAVQLARQVDGVTSVRDLLQVVAVGDAEQVARSDERILDALEQRLGSDPRFTGLSWQVAGGVVRLLGIAKDPGGQLEAVRIARGTPGVKNVVQDLAFSREGPGA